MKILIATGIYPPDIGGPAQYAQNTETEFKKMGHEVRLLTFRFERKLPTGVRHLWFFFRVLFSLRGVDMVFVLDTFSAALPAVLASRLFGTKALLRTGGDFLWENYVERTGDMVLFKDFYATRMRKLNLKERMIFRMTRWILHSCDAVIFSTVWQRDIFTPAYKLDSGKNRIVENFYGPKIKSYEPTEKLFIAGTRPLKWKNIARLKEAFAQDTIRRSTLVFDDRTIPHSRFIERIQHCYAVVLVSLGDISPNTILDAVRADKPFILTRECGLYEKLKDTGLFVDPENVTDIAEKLHTLADPSHYSYWKHKVESFTFTHTWEEICREILVIHTSLL